MDLLEKVCEDAWCSLKQLLELSDFNFRRLVGEEICYPILHLRRLRRVWEEAKQYEDDNAADSMDVLEKVCNDACCPLKRLLELSDFDFRRLVSEEICYPILHLPRLLRAWEEAKQHKDDHAADSMDVLEKVCNDACCSLKRLLELSDSDFRRLVSEEICYPVLRLPRLRRAWEEAKQHRETFESDGTESRPLRMSSKRCKKRKSDRGFEMSGTKRSRSEGPATRNTTSADTRKRAAPESSSDESDSVYHNEVCEVCNEGGEILCCDTCNLVFHLQCHIPSLNGVPDGKWSCSYCHATQRPTHSQSTTHKIALQAIKEMDMVRYKSDEAKAMERIPKVNDRFRIMRHHKFLGSTYPSWVFGSVTKVVEKKKSAKPNHAWKRFTLTLKLDYGRMMTTSFPLPDVQLLNVDNVTGSAFAEMEDGSRVLAYHRDMTKLALGDLVDCLYQGGAVANGACFRGRVAAIYLESNTCDVLYFDRDYERNVPIDAVNLCIVEHGQSAPTWLEGFNVPADFKNLDKCSQKGPKRRGAGKIFKFGQRGNGEQDKELILEIEFPGGRFESAKYSEVVPAIFGAILDSTEAAKIILWPTASSCASPTNENSIPQNGKEEQKIARSQKARLDKEGDEECEGAWQDEFIEGFHISSKQGTNAPGNLTLQQPGRPDSP